MTVKTSVIVFQIPILLQHEYDSGGGIGMFDDVIHVCRFTW